MTVYDIYCICLSHTYQNNNTTIARRSPTNHNPSLDIYKLQPKKNVIFGRLSRKTKQIGRLFLRSNIASRSISSLIRTKTERIARRNARKILNLYEDPRIRRRSTVTWSQSKLPCVRGMRTSWFLIFFFFESRIRPSFLLFGDGVSSRQIRHDDFNWKPHSFTPDVSHYRFYFFNLP